MGKNFAEVCSKLATNGMSTLESVPLKTTQDHLFLAGKGRDGDKQKESFSDGKINKETPETETETGSKEIVEMRSPSFSNDLRVEERRDKPTEKTQLLSQDKTETDKATTVDVEEETVMLKRSETEKRRGFELSLGLSMIPTRRSDADNSFKETRGSGENLVEKKSNTSESLFIYSVGSSKAQETTEVNDLRTKERIRESTEQILLLCQDKTETYEATINVEKKTVMLKRSETEKTRGFELSLGLSMKPGERSDDSLNLKETKDTGDNLLEKKASTKGRVRKRSKYSLFGSCLCFATAMN